MRIGVAALGRLSEDTGGRNYIVHFFRELARGRHGMEFVLYVSEDEAEAIGIQQQDWLRIVELPHTKRTPLHKVFGEQIILPAAIERERIDVMYYPGNFVALRSKIPAVVNIRATAHFYGNEYGIRGIRRLIRSLLMPASARKAQAIITPSEDIKRDVIRFTGVASEKIHVIPHGVDTSLFDGDTNRHATEGQSLLQHFELEPQTYILYVSALWRYKNQLALIDAFANEIAPKYPSLKLVLAGRGTGVEKAYLNELHKRVTDAGLGDRVVFTGAQPQSNLRYLYAHATLFVFPSRYESFGNPLFEAWASSIPVAASNVHSFPEIVGNAGLLFDPEHAPDIAAAIERLLDDQSLRATLITNGQQRIKNFTWEECVARTLSVIEYVRALTELMR